jgi:RND family efflux transporter MFP subunit
MKKWKIYWQSLKTLLKAPIETPKRIAISVGVLLLLWVISGFFAPVQEVAHARRTTALDTVTGTVKVSAAVELTVRAKVAGRMSWLKPVNAAGVAPVKEGEVFAKMDSSELDRDIELQTSRQKILQEQIDVGSVNELEIANARTELSIAESMFHSGQLSKSELEKKRRDVEKLERTWQRETLDLKRQLAEATYDLNTRLDHRSSMQIKSPISGNLSVYYILEGQDVNPNDAIALVRSPEMTIEVSIPEEDFAGVKVGQPVTLAFTGVAGSFDGKVAALAISGNADTHRRSVFVEVKNPVANIVPGSTGYATIVKAQRKNSVVIPRRALFGDSVYVYWLGSLQRKKVQVGYQSFESVEIVKGLHAGEAVVLSGAEEPTSGTRARVRWVE